MLREKARERGMCNASTKKRQFEHLFSTCFPPVWLDELLGQRGAGVVRRRLVQVFEANVQIDWSQVYLLVMAALSDSGRGPDPVIQRGVKALLLSRTNDLSGGMGVPAFSLGAWSGKFQPHGFSYAFSRRRFSRIG
jgi:hypothetical protein